MAYPGGSIFLFVKVMENVGTINDSVISDKCKKETISTENILLFFPLYYNDTRYLIQMK